MVSEIQFLATAAFLIWCLASSISGALGAADDEACLVWREHGPSGWSAWREVHFGLTGSDHRVLSNPEGRLDSAARESLLEAVHQQPRHADSNAVQYAVVRMSADQVGIDPVFMSNALQLQPVN